jgi:hypothetical protein
VVLPDWDELLEWLKARWWVLFTVLALSAWGLNAWMTGPLHPPPGVLAPEEPIQGPPLSTEPWTYRDHRLISLATFDLHARVLSRERYRFDRAAELSPLDLAMGWGRMSDSAVLDQINIRQDGRWYYWSTAHFPIPAEEIISHSANMHMIPADAWVKRQLLALRVGQVVHLQGQLIQAEGRDQWKWRSSLSRTDTGDGACEVIWVETVEPS